MRPEWVPRERSVWEKPAAFGEQMDRLHANLKYSTGQIEVTSGEVSSAAGKGSPVTLVAVVDKDTPGGACRIASLTTPIKPDDQLGKTLKFLNPINGTNAELPLLSRDCVPEVPALGSVGYLTHMAHIALVLIGEGTVWSRLHHAKRKLAELLAAPSTTPAHPVTAGSLDA